MGPSSEHTVRYTAIMMDLALAVLQCCTVQYGELGGNGLSSSEEDDVMEGRR